MQSYGFILKQPKVFTAFLFKLEIPAIGSHELLLFLSTYGIPLPLQFSCFTSNLHVVEWIAQSQTLEYRFGRYLPVLFAQAHNILQGVPPIS